MGHIIDAVISFQEHIANDNTHGYDQLKRWGPNFDCSSLQIESWWQKGVPVKENGATNTSNMKSAFLKSGFIDVTKLINLSTGKGLIRGDVLLRIGKHTALYIGNGKIIQALSNEKGGKTGGQTGDQTGFEIYIRSYYVLKDTPWDIVLRYVESEGDNKMIDIMSGGAEVAAVQQFLIDIGFGRDMNPAFIGTGGPKTKAALIAFQAHMNIPQTGILDNATQSGIFRYASRAFNDNSRTVSALLGKIQAATNALKLPV